VKSEHTETELDDDKLESAGNFPHQQLDLDAETIGGAARVALPYLTLGQNLGGRSESVSDALELGSESRGGGCLGENIRIVGHSSSGLICIGSATLIQRVSSFFGIKYCSLLMLAV
jgi:hypothetical protein